MSTTKKTTYGQVRGQAYDLWRGPDYLIKQAGPDQIGGLPVLAFLLRSGTSLKPVLESRIVFGRTDEPSALLRAVSWDSSAINSRDPALKLKMPLKCVEVPVQQIQDWIGSFAHLTTALPFPPYADDSIPICSLRIELDSVYATFQKTWQMRSESTDAFQNNWVDTWKKMEQCLQTHAACTEFSEHFEIEMNTSSVYDIGAYQAIYTL